MKTLKTLVLKTVTVTGVKLGTPADRIGLGLVVLVYRLTGSRRSEPPALRDGKGRCERRRAAEPAGSAVPPTSAGPTFPVISVTRTDSAATANRPTG
jgi:hypothetical protein